MGERKILVATYFQSYLSLLGVDITKLFAVVTERPWNAENFKFFTAVSVMSSSKIEGEELEVDSYVNCLRTPKWLIESIGTATS